MMYHLLFLCNRLLVSMLLKIDVFFLLILLFMMKGLELSYILVEQVQDFATSTRIPNKQLIDITLSFNWFPNKSSNVFNQLWIFIHSYPFIRSVNIPHCFSFLVFTSRK